MRRNNRETKVFNSDTAEMFRDTWAEFDPLGSGFLKVVDFKEFLFCLGKPLGWDSLATMDESE